jgi:hypothetical protein
MFFHFTDWHHLHGIARYGLTVGDVPTDLGRCEGRCGIWLTTDGDTALGRHGLDGSRFDKTRYRLTVEVDENDAALVRWTDWAVAHATPETIRCLHAVASGFASWFVYFGVVDPKRIIACIDMQTGLAVEDWRNTPEGQVKPVAPDRRHVWHKKLMRKFRRAYAGSRVAGEC